MQHFDKLNAFLSYSDNPDTETDDWIVKRLVIGAIVSDLTSSIGGTLVAIIATLGSIYIAVTLGPEEGNVKIAAIAVLTGGGAFTGTLIAKQQPKELNRMQVLMSQLQMASQTPSSSSDPDHPTIRS